MADVRCKPFSFYVPEHDTELMRFMAYQSNMSLSMRLLMKAFLAANRHVTDIDISTVDLADLIKSVKVDPASLPGGTYKGRGNAAIQDAREAGFIARHEQLALQEAGIPAAHAAARTADATTSIQEVDGTAAAQEDTAPAGHGAARDDTREPAAQEQPVSAYGAHPGSGQAAADMPAWHAAQPAPKAPAPRQSAQDAGDYDDLDPAAMMGGM